MSGFIQPDMNQQASVIMSLQQWNNLLMLLRTGTGQAFAWDTVNPLVNAITGQLQQQMYPQPGNQPKQFQQQGRNGPDNPLTTPPPC